MKKMASNTHILAIVLGSVLHKVTGYYCDNDECKEEEFCCGENTCCVSYKVWELWYFWCGILFFLFLLSLCGIFWRQRSRAHWVFRVPTPYSPLTPEDEEAKYSPSRNDPYLTSKEKLGPHGSFYNPSDKQMPWYSPPPNNNLVAQAYIDTDTIYDENVQKVEY